MVGEMLISGLPGPRTVSTGQAINLQSVLAGRGDSNGRSVLLHIGLVIGLFSSSHPVQLATLS